MLRSLTAELDDKKSPVWRFLDSRFTSALRDVQRRYRTDAPSLVVLSADRQEANPGTFGAAVSLGLERERSGVDQHAPAGWGLWERVSAAITAVSAAIDQHLAA